MLKKLVEKRVNLFKTGFPDYQTSKKGNLYFRYKPSHDTLNIHYSGFSMTKGTFSKVGTTDRRLIQTQRAIFLIKPDTGKLLVKREGAKNYKLATMRDVISLECEAFTNCFFVGRKFEYLKEYPKLWLFRIFQNFNSLKEAKKFLGFGFLSDDEFTNIFKNTSGYAVDYVMMMGITKNKAKFVSLMNSEDRHQEIYRIFEDYVRMCREVDLRPTIPGTFKRLKTLHDDLSKTLSLRKAANASNEVIFETRYVKPEEGKTFYCDAWERKGIQFKQLVTKREMYYQGLKQKHCIGSAHSDMMGSYSYYTITFKGSDYDIQVIPTGRVGHFYGSCNTTPPEELREMIYDDTISYVHNIVRIKSEEDLEKHELKSIKGNGLVAAEAEDYDDLPFF